MTKVTVFNKIKTLVMMQLKQKLDLSFMQSKKKFWFKLLYILIGIVVETLLIYLGFTLGVKFGFLTLNANLPNTVLVFLFTLMMLLSIISCTFGLMRALYFSRDNQVLFTLPVQSNHIFISKLIVFYINELRKNLTYVLPIFVAFALVNSIGFAFVPIMIVSFFLISMLPVMIGAILSIPLMLITMLLRKVKILQFIVYGGLAFVFVWCIFFLISLIPQDLNLIGSFGVYYWQIQSFLNNFSKAFIVFKYLTDMIVGQYEMLAYKFITLQSFKTMMVLIASLIGGLTISYFSARPLFFKMTSKPFEYKAKLNETSKTNIKHSIFTTTFKKDFTSLVRTPQNLFNSVAPIVMLPFIIMLLNKIYNAMDTSNRGNNMMIAFNILIILLVLLSSNAQVASIFSREGSASYQLKTKPVSAFVNVLSKLFFNIVISILSIIATTILLKLFTNLKDLALICIFVTTLLFDLGHILWSAELDILNPKYSQYEDGATTITNPNENKSTIIGFLIAFLFAGFALFLFLKDGGSVITWWKLIAISVGFFAIRIYLFYNKIYVYFREF